MNKNKVNWLNMVEKTLQAIDDCGGLFLVTKTPEGQPNIMAIGWIQFGVVWGRSVSTVLVRPSRYTFQLIESSGHFTVSVPVIQQRDAVRITGTLSGKNLDKFSRTGLTPQYHPGSPVPGISECPVDICCRVIQKTRVDSAQFDATVVVEYYPENDFHTVYFGQIDSVWSAD